MKTACVAVVLLSLVSVCQPASLACEALVEPVDQRQDVQGKWYFVAIATTYCWGLTLINTLGAPSIHVDVTSTSETHYYNFNFKLKVNGICDNNTEKVFSETNSLLLVDNNNVQTDLKGLFLRTRCADCLVVKEDDTPVDILVLLSKKPNITAADLKEFEAQADCLGLYKPQVLNTDHDWENCENMNNTTTGISEIDATQRIKSMFSGIFTCITDKFLYYPRTVLGWIQDAWSGVW